LEFLGRNLSFDREKFILKRARQVLTRFFG
jgi:hypothetical protein